jgi:hypothetical protein
MSTMSEQSRARAKEKVSRLTSAKVGVVDASGWKNPPAEKDDVQTGMRVLSRRAFKKGGKVMGKKAMQRADRKPRAKGGGIVDDYFNVDQKKANELRDGDKQDGGLKKGGRVAKMVGGPMMGRPAERPVMPARTGAAPIGIRPQVGPRPMMRKAGGKVHADKAEDKKLIKSELNKVKSEVHNEKCTCAKCSGGKVAKAAGGATLGGTRPTGDRVPRKAGGRTKKGGMNVNIIIAQPPAKPPMGPPMGGPPPGAGPVGMHQSPPPPPAAAPAPMQAPPQMRKRGGRTYPIESGGGGGLGRLEKIAAYG